MKCLVISLRVPSCEIKALSLTQSKCVLAIVSAVGGLPVSRGRLHPVWLPAHTPQVLYSFLRQDANKPGGAFGRRNF